MIKVTMIIGEYEHCIECDTVIVKNHRNEKLGTYQCVHDDYTMHNNLSHCDKFEHIVNCNMNKVTVWK